MKRIYLVGLVAFFAASGCITEGDDRTLADLKRVDPDLKKVRLDDGLDAAMDAYRKYLAEAPKSARTPEAMRRLADLELEKEYGLYGQAKVPERPARTEPTPRPDATVAGATPPASPAPPGTGDGPMRVATAEELANARAAALAAPWEADGLEERTFGEAQMPARNDAESLAEAGPLPGGAQAEGSGPKEAIRLYDEILANYPNYEHNDRVLYQKARALDELGRPDEAIAVAEQLVDRYPFSRYVDEVQFRRGEYFFMRRKFLDAEEAYSAVVTLGKASDYYELSLYKLGWSFYKQEMHEEALQQFIGLLDHKVSVGYDFDQRDDETSERRVADTFRVISLSFSNLGGPEVLENYFAVNGPRTYEDRIYSHLGEFYLDKRRYQDAAAVYASFVGLHPYHAVAPHFSMRIVEIYEKGGFPKLVLDAKKDFAARYGLASNYWQHADVENSPDVLAYLKNNLESLASHYHAYYQRPDKKDEAKANFDEALKWYGQYLASFPRDPETPGLHYQMADLIFEAKDYGRAAREYERTAYDYPAHEKSSTAGYAAVTAHRQHLKVASEAQHDLVREAAVESSLRFAETFPDHENAPRVLATAVEDLYDMRRYELAVDNGRILIERYPDTTTELRHTAWAVVAHASFDLERYVDAEQAYTQVLALTDPKDEAHAGFVDNLAASIYKQGELAAAAGDDRLAAQHYLRIVAQAPTSKIRPNAEYDAGAAFVRLEDWTEAARVFEAFRASHPKHELAKESTKQIANVYRSAGDIARAADEYERVSREAEETELRREALLLAGELHEEAKQIDRARDVYQRYVDAFPEPLEVAVETRFTLAGLYRDAGDEKAHYAQLRRIVDIDRAAGDARTDRIRLLAGRSALVLTEDLYTRFAEIELLQPFEENLERKRARMKQALDGFNALIDYEVGEVTAAATFYIAQIYGEFGRSLMESERPTGLSARDMSAYELVLEEEAYPFEERSIEVHEKNLELMDVGVYNRWVEKSMTRLATLMPGRYAKFEETPGFLTSIDRYAYREPGADQAEPVQEAPEVPEEPGMTPAAVTSTTSDGEPA